MTATEKMFYHHGKMFSADDRALSDMFFFFIKINITHAHYILIKIYVLLLVSMLHYYYKQLPYRHVSSSFCYKIVKGLNKSYGHN